MSTPKPVNYPLLRFNLSFDQPGQVQLDIEGITQFLQQYQLHQNPTFKAKRCKYPDCKILDCSYGHHHAIMAAIKAIREQNGPPSSPRIVSSYPAPLHIPADGRPVTFLPTHPLQTYPIPYFPPPPPYLESPQIQPQEQQSLTPSAWTLSQETEELNDQTWQDIEQALNELRDE